MTTCSDEFWCVRPLQSTLLKGTSAGAAGFNDVLLPVFLFYEVLRLSSCFEPCLFGMVLVPVVSKLF